MKRLILALFLLVPACGRGFSDGQRRGTVVKFSKKGLVCKTYEGAMNLGGLVAGGEGGAVPNVWEFTVLDEALVPKIVATMDSGSPTTLVYTQWWWKPPCSMDTEYEIVGIK